MRREMKKKKRKSMNGRTTTLPKRLPFVALCTRSSSKQLSSWFHICFKSVVMRSLSTLSTLFHPPQVTPSLVALLSHWLLAWSHVRYHCSHWMQLPFRSYAVDYQKMLLYRIFFYYSLLSARRWSLPGRGEGELEGRSRGETTIVKVTNFCEKSISENADSRLELCCQPTITACIFGAPSNFFPWEIIRRTSHLHWITRKGTKCLVRKVGELKSRCGPTSRRYGWLLFT